MRNEETIAERAKGLEKLRAQEEALHAFRERECELEVELIAAETALKAASSKGGPDLDPGRAAAIAEALDRKRELQVALDRLEQQSARGGRAGSSELEQLRAGRDALVSWLDAPRRVRRQRLPRVTYAVLLAAVVAVVWAAVVVHPVLLLLLIPLSAPFAFLSLSGQDLVWLRLGAERHFKETGLKPPVTWEEPSVRDRVLELEGVMDAIPRRVEDFTETEETAEGDREVLAAELAQAEVHLEAVLADAALDADSIDAEFERWLGLMSQARRAWEELEKVKARRKGIRAETNDGRERLFRFLSRQGEAPGEGRADLDALAAGLERVAVRSMSREDGTGGGPTREGGRETE